MATRKTILDAVAAQLATIQIAAGYINDTASPVLREIPHSDKVKESRRITLAVEDLGELEKLGRFKGGKVLARFRCVVRAFCVSPEFLKVPTDQAGNICADIERLVEKKPHGLGANCRFWESIDTQNEGLGASEGFIDMILQVTFWYTGANP